MVQPEFQLRLSQDDAWSMDRLHFHENIEILVPLSDGDNLFVDNKLYPLRRGELFLLNESTLHKTNSSKPYKRYVLHISPRTLEALSTPQSDFYAYINKAQPCITLSEEETTHLISLFQQLEQPQSEAFGGDWKRNIALLEFLLAVFSFVSVAPTKANIMLNSDFVRITPILQYIKANIAEQLPLDVIAAHFFINKFHLCHIFKEATGFSVVEYIIHCRILKARELLRKGIRVQEVGELVGFQNNEHFIRTFGTLTGISPKKYAKKYLESDKC